MNNNELAVVAVKNVSGENIPKSSKKRLEDLFEYERKNKGEINTITTYSAHGRFPVDDYSDDRIIVRKVYSEGGIDTIAKVIDKDEVQGTLVAGKDLAPVIDKYELYFDHLNKKVKF